MNILTFTSLFPNKLRPNFGVFVFQRVLNIARRPGISVRVVAPVPYFPSWIRSSRWDIHGQVPRGEKIEGLDVYHPRYPLLPAVLMRWHGFLIYRGCLSAVRRLHSQFHFDCIDAHYVYPDGYAAILLGKALQLPVIVSARGTDINVFPSYRAIRPMIQRTLRQAAGVIAVSEALRSAMIDLGADGEKICTIPNGVDVRRFHPYPRMVARRKLGIPEAIKMVVSVGALLEGKNHDVLIAAFAENLQGHPENRLYIVGEGPRRAALEELIRRLKLTDKVFLMGTQPNEELAAWFSAADVSCLASSREGWPNVVMESIACGTPVVATRVGGIPEILTSPELGILVEKDQQAIAAGLRSALARDWDRDALVRYAQARDWNGTARAVEQFIEPRVLSRHA